MEEIQKQRKTFRSLTQHSFESNLEYLERLTKQARRCNFEDFMDTENKIFRHAAASSNFKSLATLAMRRKWNLSELKLGLESQERTLNSDGSSCYRCGSKFHGADDDTCYGKFSVCRYCNRQGHMTHMCWHKSPQRVPKDRSPLASDSSPPLAYLVDEDDILEAIKNRSLNASTLHEPKKDWSDYNLRQARDYLSTRLPSTSWQEQSNRIERVLGTSSPINRSPSPNLFRYLTSSSPTSRAIKRESPIKLESAAKKKTREASTSTSIDPKLVKAKMENLLALSLVNSISQKDEENFENQLRKKKVTFRDPKMPTPKPISVPSVKKEEKTFNCTIGDVVGKIIISDEFAVNVMSTKFFEANKIKCSIYSNKEVNINGKKFIGELETLLKRGKKSTGVCFYFSDFIDEPKCILTSYNANKLILNENEPCNTM